MDMPTPQSPEPITWWRVIAAPWLGVVRPRAAAATFARASRRTMLLSFLLGVALLSAAVVWLVVWDRTSTVRWPGVTRVNTSTRPFTFKPTYHHATIREEWVRWGEGAWIHPGVLLGMTTAGLTLLSTALVAWLFLPGVHSGGPVRDSIGRALRCVASGVGLLALLVLGLGAWFVAAHHAEIADRAAGLATFRPGAVLILMLGVPAGLCHVFAWLRWAMAGVGHESPSVVIPPMCEGCGYDLTHRPENGLCPECGLAVEDSLTEGIRRPGCAWERGEVSGATWLEASYDALMAPRTFYGRLTLRTQEQRSRAYPLRHYACMGAGAWAWLTFILVTQHAPPDALIFAPIIFLLAIPLIGGVLHRLVGALIASWWVTRHALPDIRWVRKLIAYEAVYLWVFCAYNGLAITSFVLGRNMWRSIGLGNPFRSVLGMPLAAAVIVYGNAALILFWLYRYRIAGRAVRWANY